MTTPDGPRIIVKDDRDSSIGRGCVLHGGHFRPEISIIFYTAAQTAPNGVTEVLFSEGWRPPPEVEDPGTRDLHPELRAIDVSLNTIFPDPATGSLDVDALLRYRRKRGIEWADRIRKQLGPDYHVVVHGDGWNCHIHIELDPR